MIKFSHALNVQSEEFLSVVEEFFPTQLRALTGDTLNLHNEEEEFQTAFNFLNKIVLANDDKKFRQENNIKQGRYLNDQAVCEELFFKVKDFLEEIDLEYTKKLSSLAPFENHKNELGEWAIFFSSCLEDSKAIKNNIQSLKAEFKLSKLDNVITQIKSLAERFSLADEERFIELVGIVSSFAKFKQPAYEFALTYGQDGVFTLLAQTGLIPKTEDFWSEVTKQIRIGALNKEQFVDLEASFEESTFAAVRSEMVKLHKRAQVALNNLTYLLARSLIGDRNENFIIGQPTSKYFNEDKLRKFPENTDEFTKKIKTYAGRLEVRRIVPYTGNKNHAQEKREILLETSPLVIGLKSRLKSEEVFIRKLVTEQFAQLFFDSQKKIFTGLQGIADLLALTIIIDTKVYDDSTRRKFNYYELLENDERNVRKVAAKFQSNFGFKFDLLDLQRMGFENKGRGQPHFLERLPVFSKDYYADPLKDGLKIVKEVNGWLGYTFEMKFNSYDMEEKAEKGRSKFQADLKVYTEDDIKKLPKSHNKYREEQIESFKKKIIESPAIGFTYAIAQLAMLKKDSTKDPERAMEELHQDPLLKEFFKLFKFDFKIQTGKVKFSLSKVS